MNVTLRRIKTTILTILFLALHGVEFVRETAIINPIPVMNITGIVLVLFSAVFLVPDFKGHIRRININTIKNNPLRSSIVVLWLVFTILAAFSKAHELWPVIFFLLFGLLFLIKLNQEEKNMLIRSFFLGNALGFICIQAFAYGFRPYDVVRYRGPFANSNITGLYYVIIYTMVLFFIHYLVRNKAKRLYVFLSVVAAAYLISLVIITVGRTALLVGILETILFLLMVVWHNWEWKLNKAILAGFILLISTVVMVNPTYATVRYLPGILHHPVWFLDEYSESKVHSFDPITSDKYISLERVFFGLLGRNVKGFVSEETYNNLMGYDVQDDDVVVIEVVKAPDSITEHVEFEQGTIMQRIDRFSSDRIKYLTVYIRNMNFTGHDKSQEVWLADEQVFNTQNIFVQPAWDYGIPAGIVFAILSVLLWIYNIMKYLKSKNNVYSVLPIMIMFLFYLFGQLEVVWEYGMIILWLFFFVQHPMFTESLED